MSKAVVGRLTVAALSMAVCSVAVSAQATPPKTTPKTMEKPMEMMDHSKMEAEHGKSAWKELDAYHMLMMATWHPAKGTGDMAPLKAKAADMEKAAKLWADSKPPKGCDAPKLKDAVAKVNTGSKDLAAMVTKGTDDATLKSKLSELHDTFEIVEGGCKPESEHK